MKSDSRELQRILWFKDISIQDVPLVGGKTASLGEMYGKLGRKGIRVPDGFAVTARAYRDFLESTGLKKKLKILLKNVDVRDIGQLKRVASSARKLIMSTSLPLTLQKEIVLAYKTLAKSGDPGLVAVRSSATAEDLPAASFAGQQESFLNIRGEKAVLSAVHKCMASLFTDRALSYRETKGYDHLEVALSVAVQRMVRAENGVSGVMFTLDTESGFQGVVLIDASYGLGEYVVKGKVNPDQYYIFKEGLRKGKKALISKILGKKDIKLVSGKSAGTKQQVVSAKDQHRFCLNEAEALQLAQWALLIEEHYGKPQDIEWAKDGETGEFFIVQARPETVKSLSDHAFLEVYRLKHKGELLLSGVAVGQKIGAGKVRVIQKPSEMKSLKKGEVLVTHVTDPDWEPIMRIAGAIVTEKGGKTSHAAIVSRELGVPCVVGVENATKVLKDGTNITVSCAEGEEGRIYKGILPYELKRSTIQNIPSTKTKIMMNMGDPHNAFSLSFLPNDGIGLARLEFIFSNFIRIHPLALVHYAKLKDKKAKKKIAELTLGYSKKTDYCVDKLAEGIARIAVSSYPKEVVVRLSDFKTNEYATLVGGAEFEPKEENPMLGWRGASRYYSKAYKPAFKLECQAIQKAREEWGLDNIVVMVPFCRTPEEGQKVLKTMEEYGLKQGQKGLKVFVMCEIPSNVILAEEYAKLFDGFSIGSNDLTQLVLGVDRDSDRLSSLYSEDDESVKTLIKQVIKSAHKYKKTVGICGQAPSDNPEFAEFLVQQGIDSISLNPDTVLGVRERVAYAEKTLGKTGRRTNKAFVSLVLALGVLSAGFMSLGAGCADVLNPAGSFPRGSELNITPASIRERAVEKVLQQKDQELKAQRSLIKNNTFANFEMEYPSSWTLEQWNGGLTINSEDGSGYLSIFKQLLVHPIPDSQKEDFLYQNIASKLYRIPGDEPRLIILEVPLDEEGGILEINVKSEDWGSLLSGIKLQNPETDTKPVYNHWDVREKRLCAQMITYAKESGAGVQCQIFSTPCAVPEGWKVCDAEDIGE
ncbi:MAG: phosphoenolpyruvate synthase [Candidatus Magasanikbacteria bacterium]|nr:phosphoenolpyruvate synthase [Candidatus Magasanikbacteria bacterium]